ncbi:hypothetical protein AC481_01720 [miscellaneous Crenarchaeota group archaeon SMTZ-80]|nr:MAG: hypothetical protein AC481_01720 [miscellaneous Crenarchaeota group archaeon SMTZ-80]
MSNVLLRPDTEFKVGKIVCVGLNYAKHIGEMKAERTREPILFLKPSTSLLKEGYAIILPSFSNQVHHEIELALLVGKAAKGISKTDWRDYIIGAGIALDLTLRDIQDVAKSKGYPWSVCKGFDGACPISSFVPLNQISDIQNLHLELQVNNTIKQQGSTKNMIFPVDHLFSYISKIFTLEVGDILLTGTPAGVGQIKHGDHIKAKISEIGEIEFMVK